MFAIYNNGSVGFRSTVDNLYQLKNLDGPGEARMKPDDDTLFQEYMDSKKDKKQNQSQQNNKAVNAYKKMANIDTSEAVYHVKDIMNRDCIYIDNHSTLLDAYNVLKKYQVSNIPVVSNGRKIIGLINKKIILNLLIEDIKHAQSILNKKVQDIYLKEVITTDPISDIRRVAKVMLDFKLDAIPVVDNYDTLVGIVSKTDIIKAVSTIPKLQLWS